MSVRAGDEPIAGPPASIRFRRRIRPLRSVREIWGARELILTLAERDLRARYKQAVLGFAWALVTPVVLMVVFSLFFTKVAKVDTQGAPYTLFAYLGLLPWTFFSSSVSQGGTSLITNNSLLNKVYCPREAFPIASVATTAVDTAIATLVLAVLFVFDQTAPKGASVWVPVLLAVQLAFTLGVTLAVSSVVVYLRDLRHALPMILQLGLFATPIAYALDVIPNSWRGWYVAINPLATVVDGYRRTILYNESPRGTYLLISGAAALVWLTFGYLLFKRMETGLADVA